MAPVIPKIISVDDHVIEPANVWQDRLPERFKSVGPRLVDGPTFRAATDARVRSKKEGVSGKRA